jgi:hypothetical protein
MGLGTLITRAASQTILASWFNDLKSVLCLDLVPRDANGVPADKGGSLGTQDYQWQNVRAEKIWVDGSLIDATELSRPTHYIVSGKANDGDGPNFLAVGTGLTSDVDTSTPLAMVINNVDTQISSNFSFSSLTAAPATNNTCAVDGGGPYSETFEYSNPNLGVSGWGSALTARDGTVQAFQYESDEIFLAKLDLTNDRMIILSRGFCGTTRSYMSDSYTVTLLQINTLLQKNDGATRIVSTYYPQTVSTVPAAATAGKIYIEASTGRIAYDNGSAISYDYTIIGFAVADDTECVGVHPADFRRAWSDEANVEFESGYGAGSYVVNIMSGSFANVQGTEVRFDTGVSASLLTDLASGETLDFSTVYFLYLKSDGSFEFSKKIPNKYSMHKKGYYHPTKYYRCLLRITTAGSGAKVIASASEAKIWDRYASFNTGF